MDQIEQAIDRVLVEAFQSGILRRLVNLKFALAAPGQAADLNKRSTSIPGYYQEKEIDWGRIQDSDFEVITPKEAVAVAARNAADVGNFHNISGSVLVKDAPVIFWVTKFNRDLSKDHNIAKLFLPVNYTIPADSLIAVTHGNNLLSPTHRLGAPGWIGTCRCIDATELFKFLPQLADLAYCLDPPRTSTLRNKRARASMGARVDDQIDEFKYRLNQIMADRYTPEVVKKLLQKIFRIASARMSEFVELADEDELQHDISLIQRSVTSALDWWRNYRQDTRARRIHVEQEPDPDKRARKLEYYKQQHAERVGALRDIYLKITGVRKP